MMAGAASANGIVDYLLTAKELYLESSHRFIGRVAEMAAIATISTAGVVTAVAAGTTIVTIPLQPLR